MLSDYFHLDEIDPSELMSIVLNNFGNATNIGPGQYKYQTTGSEDFLLIEADITTGRVTTVTSSPNFPEKKLKEIEKSIKTNLMDYTESVAQEIVFCYEKVDGSYRYKDLFQIFPVPEGSPLPKVGLRNFPFVIEFKYKSSKDTFIDYCRRREKATTYVRLLNLLINQNLKLNSNNAQSYWVMEMDEVTKSVSYKDMQSGYAAKGLDGKRSDFTDISRMSPIDEISFQDYYTNIRYRGNSSDPLRIPNNLTKSLDKIFSLNQGDWNRFYMSVSWYSQSSDVYSSSNSSSFISLVTALECLVGEREKCKCCNQDVPVELNCCDCCGQPRYQVTKHFMQFLKTYFPSIDSFSAEKKTLYSVRSKLAHGIDLLQQDLKPWLSMMSARGDDEHRLQGNLMFISNIAIYNWMWSRDIRNNE